MSESNQPRRLPPITTWLAWLLPIFAWAPLAYPGYPEVHSGFLPVFNLNALAAHLPDPRWSPLVGQSFDLWRGERALPYFLAALPVALGAEPVTAVKLILGASIVGGALGVYAWVRRRAGLWPGLLASTVYALWPFGLATLYVRGAFAEVVFLGLAPWLLWATDSALITGRKAYAAALALLLASLAWTQAGLALWYGLSCLAYTLLMRAPHTSSGGQVTLSGSRRRLSLRRAVSEESPLRVAGLGWAGGVLLALFGLFLAAVGAAGGHGAGAVSVTFGDHFVYPHQLVSSAWDRGPSVPGPFDTLPFQLGLVVYGLALFSLVGPGLAADTSASREANGPRATDGGLRVMRNTAAVAVLVLAFLSSSLSAPLWSLMLPPAVAGTLTYPWQLLTTAGPWLAALAGLGGLALSRILAGIWPDGAEAAPLYAGLIVLVVLGSYAYLAAPAATLSPPDRPLAIFGDNEIALVSATVRGSPGPDQPITLELAWQGLRPLERDYTVFFHAIGPDGSLQGQQDAMPRAGALPTNLWQPGQVITDQLRLVLKPDAPAGSGYSYLLGLYRWQTGERLRAGGDDKVVLTGGQP